MLPALGSLIHRHCRTILLVGFLLVVGAAIQGADTTTRLSQDGGFGDPNSETARAIAVLRENLGSDESPVLVLFSPKESAPFPAQVDDPGYRSVVESLLGKLGDNPDVHSVFSYYSTDRSYFKSKDGRQTYAVVNLAYGNDYGYQAFKRLHATLVSEDLEVRLGGEIAINFDNEKQLREDLIVAEMVSFPILAIALLIVFGSVVAAGLPLLVGGITVVCSMALLKLATHFMDVTVFSANVVSTIGLGLAIDYSLFVVSRFREELSHGRPVSEAVAISVATAGRTVLFSGVTVIVSLLSMMWFPDRFFKSMGLAGAIAVTVSVLTSITILPAALAMLGPRVNALAVRKGLAGSGKSVGSPADSVFYRLTHAVMRRPAAVLLLTLALLACLGAPFLRVKIGFSDMKALPAGSPSRYVYETISSDQFPRGDIESLFLAIKTRGPVTQSENLSALHGLVQRIGALPHVSRVDSLVSLEGDLTLEDYQQFYADPDETPMASEALELFAKGDYTRVVVYYEASHTSEEALTLTRSIRAMERPAQIEFMYVGGFPAFIIDYLGSLARGMPRVVMCIVATIFVVLFIMLGSLLVPLKAVLLNILSLSASFGALVWIFQDGRFTELLGFTRLGALDGSIVVMIFVIAFGLSMDYEVFLLSRIKEQYDLTGDPVESVALGVHRTGRIITNAAVLISIVFVVLSMGKVVFLKEMGIGLFVAVLVDATLVRLLMVPAAMHLMGHWNWWLPAPLARLHRWIGLSEAEPETPEPKKVVGL